MSHDMLTEPGVISPLYQTKRMPPTAGDEPGEHVGGDPVRDDVEAERVHAPRVVADALQGDAEGRAHDPADDAVAGERAGERQEVERHRIAPGDAEHLGRVDLAQALEAVEDAVVLQHQVVEGDADRERDHDRVDAFGAHRQPADQRRRERAHEQGDRDRRPPRPAEADLGGAARAEDGERIARHAGDRHLGERDHAAVAAEEGERERDQPEHQRLRRDLEGDERRGDERERRSSAASTTTWRSETARRSVSSRGGAARSTRPAAARLRRARRRRRLPDRRRCARVHGATPLRRAHRRASPSAAHAGRPMIPRGRNASTAIRMTKVKTTL